MVVACLFVLFVAERAFYPRMILGQPGVHIDLGWLEKKKVISKVYYKTKAIKVEI